MKKCVRYVEALHLDEVEGILVCDGSGNPYVVIEPNITMKFLDNFLWKDDPKAMEGVKEAYSQPYKFLVLFFEKDPA